MRAIVATTLDRGIGNHGELLFRHPADLHTFRQITTGGTVIMGRKTFESIGHPLAMRRNIVLSTTLAEDMDGIEVCRTVEDAIARAPDTAWVIGGAEVYKLFWPYIDIIVKTELSAVLPADTFFPAVDAGEWISMYTTFHDTCKCSDGGRYDITQRVCWRRNLDDQTSQTLANTLISTYEHMCYTTRASSIWALNVFSTLLTEGLYRVEDKYADPLNRMIAAARYAHETWVSMDSVLCEKYPTHPPSELAFLVFLLTFADQADVRDSSIYRLAAHTVLQEIIDNPAISGICSAAEIKDDELLREFFTAFADLGTLYKNPEQYPSMEHRKKHEHLMAIYGRICAPKS